MWNFHDHDHDYDDLVDYDEFQIQKRNGGESRTWRLSFDDFFHDYVVL